MIELILSLFLLIGSHEMGHQVEADRLNVEVQWNYEVSGITQYYPNATNKELELITNSAFVIQDEVGEHIKNNKYSKISGVYKITYLVRDELDMENITNASKGFIAVSALSDLFDVGLRFTQLSNETTGLVKTWRY